MPKFEANKFVKFIKFVKFVKFFKFIKFLKVISGGFITQNFPCICQINVYFRKYIIPLLYKSNVCKECIN